MATGDKLYLADKQTLDEVKQRVEDVYTHADIARQTAIDSKVVIDATKTKVDSMDTKLSEAKSSIDDVKSITTSIQNNFNADYTLPNIITKNFYAESTTAVTSGYSNIVNITGSGKLHFSVMECASSVTSGVVNTTSLSVLVDGVTIYNYSLGAGYAGTVYTVGLVSATSILGVPPGSTVAAMLTNGKFLTIGSGSRPIGATTTHPNAITPKPIKFNSSLVIRAYSTNTVSRVYYHYELD